MNVNNVACVLCAAVTKRGDCSEARAATLELLFIVKWHAQEDTMKGGGTGEKIMRRGAAASSTVGLEPCTVRVCLICDTACCRISTVCQMAAGRATPCWQSTGLEVFGRIERRFSARSLMLHSASAATAGAARRAFRHINAESIRSSCCSSAASLLQSMDTRTVVF